MVEATATPILQVRDLTKHFPLRGNLGRDIFRPKKVVKAVNGISFIINEDEAFGLVGESGSGKSTVGKLVARLIEPTQGDIRLGEIDWLSLKGKELRARRRDIQMIFQNPFLSLDPRWSVERIVGEPLKTHDVIPKSELRTRIAELLVSVGLDPAQANRYPHQFSGGQRQRIGLARALALNPRLLIADEAVSALDVSVQAQVLNLLKEIRQKNRFSMLFISHDLSVVKYICDVVGVMYLGTFVEIAPTRDLFKTPAHPYTQALLAAIPKMTARSRNLPEPPSGEIPSPIGGEPARVFRPRCPRAENRCKMEKPILRNFGRGRQVACHLANI